MGVLLENDVVCIGDNITMDNISIFVLPMGLTINMSPILLLLQAIAPHEILFHYKACWKMEANVFYLTPKKDFGLQSVR